MFSSKGTLFGERSTGSGPTRLQVDITEAGREAGVVIHAVVVKGSDGLNVYERSDVLPPR